MMRIRCKFLFVIFIGWITVVHGCLPNGVRGCDCVAQPNCGPCAQASSQSYSSYSYDNSYQQQQPASYQSSYQAPPSQYQALPLPPPPPPPPLPPPAAPEYQPPNIYLPGPSNPQTSLQSPSQEAPPVQYPSQEYQQMLSPDRTENEQPQQPPREIQTSTPQISVDPKVESYRESYRNSIVKVGSASEGNERSDQTAYRESYKHENGESVARFESGSIHAPPPEDGPTENESKDGDDYNQDIQQQMTLPIQKLSSTQVYSSLTPVATTSPTASITVPPTADVYKQPSQEYAAVLREPLEDTKNNQFFSYLDQVCTGVVLAQSKETSVLKAAKKCVEMQCAAANIHGDENDDEIFEVVYLKVADSRKDNKGFYCISLSNIPTYGNNFDKIESEIKYRKKEGKSGHTSPRFERHRESNHEKRRAPSSFNFQATTFRPRIFRFATIEPKSSY